LYWRSTIKIHNLEAQERKRMVIERNRA